jgi:hypothetical protein
VRCDARLKIYQVHFDESPDRSERSKSQIRRARTRRAHSLLLSFFLSPSLFLSLSFNRCVRYQNEERLRAEINEQRLVRGECACVHELETEPPGSTKSCEERVLWFPCLLYVLKKKRFFYTGSSIMSIFLSLSLSLSPCFFGKKATKDSTTQTHSDCLQRLNLCTTRARASAT